MILMRGILCAKIVLFHLINIWSHEVAFRLRLKLKPGTFNDYEMCLKRDTENQSNNNNKKNAKTLHSLCKGCNGDKVVCYENYKGFEEHSRQVYGNPHWLISSALAFRYKFNDEFIASFCDGHFNYEQNTLHKYLTDNKVPRNNSRKLVTYNKLRLSRNLSNARPCFDMRNIDVHPVIKKDLKNRVSIRTVNSMISVSSV